MAVKVRLTPAEMMWAASVGSARTQRACVRHQRRQYDHSGGKAVSYQQDIQSAMAELAAAWVLGVYPLGFSRERVTDLLGPNGHIFEVRYTHKLGGHLIVRTRDFSDATPDMPYILVTGADGNFLVHGYAWRSEVVCDTYLNTSIGAAGEPPMWWFPTEKLTPINSCTAQLNPYVLEQLKKPDNHVYV